MEEKEEEGALQPAVGVVEPERTLPPAAQRALAEAQARRMAMDARPAPAKELNGRKGPDPVRYGDWEKDGIISDF